MFCSRNGAEPRRGKESPPTGRTESEGTSLLRCFVLSELLFPYDPLSNSMSHRHMVRLHVSFPLACFYFLGKPTPKNLPARLGDVIGSQGKARRCVQHGKSLRLSGMASSRLEAEDWPDNARKLLPLLHVYASPEQGRSQTLNSVSVSPSSP
jgi:hypothetical protein